MHRGKALLIKSSDMVALIAFGICYVKLLQSVMALLNPFLPQPSLPLEKMVFTGISALTSCAILYAINAFLMRQNHAWLGISCAVMAYVYFYIYKMWPYPSQVVLVFLHGYSAFAFLMFVVLPYVMGSLLGRRQRLSGFSELFTNRQHMEAQ